MPFHTARFMGIKAPSPPGVENRTPARLGSKFRCRGGDTPEEGDDGADPPGSRRVVPPPPPSPGGPRVQHLPAEQQELREGAAGAAAFTRGSIAPLRGGGNAPPGKMGGGGGCCWEGVSQKKSSLRRGRGEEVMILPSFSICRSPFKLTLLRVLGN